MLLLLALLFPPVRGHTRSKVTDARNDISQINAAVKAYHTEYGKYPVVRDATLSEGLKGNVELMQCVIGTDAFRIPQQISFFEGMQAKRTSGWFKPAVYGGGFHPKSGDYLDPWGRPYQIVLGTDYDGVIPNPYLDEPEQQIRSGVIVWSLGKDGIFGRSADQDKHTRPDDVVSWR